jgi:hypothetical protein
METNRSGDHTARELLGHPTRSDPVHFMSALVGTLVFYVAALPTFAPELPYDHLAPEQMDQLERDALNITRRLLGIAGPRSSRQRTRG